MAKLFASIMCVSMSLTVEAHADTVVGRASVIDGDIIDVEGAPVRLLGVDAPEIDQKCWDSSGRPWACGKEAAKALSIKIDDVAVACQGIRRDREMRLIAVCRADGENLNAWLVAQGWALAYRKQSQSYVPEEERARAAGRGLWLGAFEPPWVWRTKH